MRINLQKGFFGEKEQEFGSYGNMKVTAFRYSTGVEALKVENEKGYFIILPFQGQQIWKLHFCGKDLSMQTTIKEPVPTDIYLDTYGGFLYHCGVAAFGVPQADDNHLQHGEIPNIEYKKAHIICGEDENGKYIAVGGTLDYDKAFVRKYQFRPECRLYENDTVLKISIDIENQRHTPMEYMYLCHINFIPMDGAKLIYSAPKDNIKLYRPAEASPSLAAYFDEIEKNPAVHDEVGAAGQVYDPEICLGLKYKGDENGIAYSLQYKKGEGACYVSHPVDVLPEAIRWISRTESEQSMGMVLPATAEHLGYMHAKRNGQIKLLAGGDTLSFNIEAGYIDDAKAEKIVKIIDEINK